jgi:hypothetical protein
MATVASTLPQKGGLAAPSRWQLHIRLPVQTGVWKVVRIADIGPGRVMTERRAASRKWPLTHPGHSVAHVSDAISVAPKLPQSTQWQAGGLGAPPASFPLHRHAPG